jgi:hypothetical protein
MKDDPKCYARSPNGLHACELAPGHAGKHEHPAARASWENVEAKQIERRGTVRVRMVEVEYEGDSDAGVAMLVGLLNGLLDGRKGSSRS